MIFKRCTYSSLRKRKRTQDLSRIVIFSLPLLLLRMSLKHHFSWHWGRSVFTIQVFIKAEKMFLQPRGFVATNNCNRKIIIWNSLGNWPQLGCHDAASSKLKMFVRSWMKSSYVSLTKRTKPTCPIWWRKCPQNWMNLVKCVTLENQTRHFWCVKKFNSI